MKKQKILQFALFSSVCIALSCSNSLKSSTDLGDRIIKDVDPNLTDIARNVKSYSDSLDVFSARSMVDMLDTFRPGFQMNPPFIAAGKNVGLSSITGEEVISYLEFRPLNFRNDGTIRSSLQSGIIDSVVLKLQCCRVKTRSSSQNISDTGKSRDTTTINVDTCSVALGIQTLTGLITDTIPLTRDSLKNAKVLGVLSVNTDSISGDTALSLNLDKSIYITKFKNAMKDTIVPSDTAAFALCLAPNANTDGIGRFWNYNADSRSPNLVVYFHASATDTALRSYTLSRDHASYTSIELKPTDASNASISSWENLRRAVYNIDVSSLASFMDTAAPDSLKYVVIQKADVHIPVSKCFFDMHVDSIRVEYKLIDSLATSKNSFSTVGNFWIRTTADTSYTVPIASSLQPLVINRKSKSVYLYLSIPSQDSPVYPIYGRTFIQVAWKPDSKIKLNAIVTNPR